MTTNKNNPSNCSIELRCEATEICIRKLAEGNEKDAESRTIEGYAAKFDRWSEPIGGWFKERIQRGAFDGTDMKDVVMCFNHDLNSILARTLSKTLSLSADETGLHFSFEAPHTSLGDDMLELVRRGDISKCSFAFIVDRDEWLYADKKNAMEYDERTILHVAQLRDVSLVVFPAYKDTEAGIRSLEERKAEFLKQHNDENANDRKENQDNVAVDSSTGNPATDQDTPTSAGVVQSESRRRLAAQLRLKERINHDN
ncbi:MAG: HK97 family phage prohead protease [Bacteroidales bacterium]|jgi:HK97 family phage prohead protease|nr:HK97 family phage prohead protease [Bacteroidales bacterium]